MESQRVAGTGFRFEAPSGWKVTRTDGRVSAEQDSELLQVATFRLAKPYTPALFGRVAVELAARMKDIAAETGGTLAGSRTVTAAGIRSHAYDVKVGDHVDEYTFVFSGRREFQLLCRRKASSGVALCKQLLASFALA